MLFKAYVICALLKKRAQTFLKAREKNTKHRNNLIFYVLMAVPYILRAQGKLLGNNLAAVDINAIGDDIFEKAFSLVQPIYESESAHVEDPDQAAKGSVMVEAVKKALQRKYRAKKSTVRKRRKA